MHDDFMWGSGMGLAAILFWVILILVVAALLKYLFGGPR